MNETTDFPGREPAWFFTAEDRGEFSVLRFGRHIPEQATDLGQTEKLWGFLEGPHVRKVLLITTLPGSLSPASMDDFWEHVRHDQAKRGFSVGESLADIEVVREGNAVQRFVTAVRSIDAFSIMTMGGECDLFFLGVALGCDYRIVTDETVFVNRFFESEVTPGLLPWFLVRFVGQGRAAQILLRPRSLDADAARELGLVDQVTSSDNLDSVALGVAERFAAKPTKALRAIKKSLAASFEDLGTYLEHIGTGFQPVR